MTSIEVTCEECGTEVVVDKDAHEVWDGNDLLLYCPAHCPAPQCGDDMDEDEDDQLLEVRDLGWGIP